MAGNKIKKLNPILETLGLIYMAKNFEAVKADMLHSLEEMNIDGKQFYKQNLSYLEDYVQDFKRSYVLEVQDEFFFAHNTEFFSAVLAIAVELFEEINEIQYLDRQRIFFITDELLNEERAENHRIPDTMEQWFAVLQVSEFSEDTKWRLLNVLHDPCEKFKELFEIYKRNKPAFDYTVQKNKKQLEKLISEAPSDISDAMRSMVNEFHPKQKNVYITAVFPLIEWMTPVMVFQGVLADKIDLYQKNMINAKERLPQILKLLGDKSKFEILYLLKSHGKYNLEIAEELHLTPATASHHMSMLLANNMVSVEKKDGRVYYQLNQETLQEIIKCFEEIFL